MPIFLWYMPHPIPNRNRPCELWARLGTQAKAELTLTLILTLGTQAKAKLLTAVKLGLAAKVNPSTEPEVEIEKQDSAPHLSLNNHRLSEEDKQIKKEVKRSNSLSEIVESLALCLCKQKRALVQVRSKLR